MLAAIFMCNKVDEIFKTKVFITAFTFANECTCTWAESFGQASIFSASLLIRHISRTKSKCTIINLICTQQIVCICSLYDDICTGVWSNFPPRKWINQGDAYTYPHSFESTLHSMQNALNICNTLWLATMDLYECWFPFLVFLVRFFDDFNPVLEGCCCYCCQNHTRAYINHLLNTKELLANVLLTM